MTKALLLYSKGLDSILVQKILEKQGIQVFKLNLGSCFFEGEVDLGEEHLEIVKKPKYGRGQGMNPCMDCHLLMYKKAKEVMLKEGYDFIATGEVVSQRPFSQSKEKLLFLEKQAGLEGLILRPLSAKLLPLTIPEKKGLVKRDEFYEISGKSRKKQLELALKFGVLEIPMPAGGCILTDKEYSKKLKKLLKINPKFDANDAKVLTKGRVFFEGRGMYIVTRNKKEGEEIKEFLRKGDIFLEPDDFPGPSVLIRGGVIQKGKEYLLKYSKHRGEIKTRLI